MHDDHHDPKVPRGFIIGAGVLILFAMVITFLGRVTDTGRVAMPDSPIVESVTIRFVDVGGGAYDVREQETGKVVLRLDASNGGFALGALRGLNRRRMQRDVDAGRPYEIARFADGRLTLIDHFADQTIEADAFGSTNAETLARLLAAAAAVH